MKTIIFYVVIALSTFISPLVYAQEGTDKSRQEIYEEKKNEIIEREKTELKQKLEKINEKLDNKEITAAEAEELKKEAAELHALNIQNRLSILENELELKERNHSSEAYIEFGGDKAVSIQANRERADKYDKRTSNDIVIAAGFNNALNDGQSLNDSDFKIGGSRFFEIGWVWKTRVFENSNWLRFKYGFSFQFNGLKPIDNGYFVEAGENTFLQEYELDLDKSKFRMDNLVVPVHFEFGPSDRTETSRSIRFSTADKLKIGLGGYAGFNIGERQKLKYKLDGDNQKDKLKGDYNTNDLIYGLSGYLGWGGAALYVKYDLNPVFDAPNPELHNISLGLRFDVD
ncbi:hypothetical protein [Christiangramia salexigens]|uniref:Outer membrane protein beta-barrel domain-containing protein n=1 Tax=Christiangramia salexigens TaxID=1913577 RepID=A0A1L3J7W1_9FLAO|nr:hypothetical protein [Christiangramia salexigens]APG61209.1 hypothetical protein LPB144_12700 [Christiangramia salexigens]